MMLVPFAAAVLCLLLVLARLLRTRQSIAGWCFVAGMVALAIDTAVTGIIVRAGEPNQLMVAAFAYGATLDEWLRVSLIVKSFLAIIWLGFSVTYSRGDRTGLKTSLYAMRWEAVIGLVPLLLSVGMGDRLFRLAATPGDDAVRLVFSGWGHALNVALLIGFVVVLMNLEQTFRAAVGTMRWQIKFVILAMVVIFGTRVYARSQALLFSAPDMSLLGLESAALLIGCLCLVVAYVRTGLAEIDVYPSLTVVRSSLTVIVVGSYLVVVGLLAQLVRRFGGAEIFQFQALVVLGGLAGLAVLLLSDHARLRIRLFAARHFSKAQHDSVRIWSLVSQRLGGVKDQQALCDASKRLVSETFAALSVSIWTLDEEKDVLVLRGATGSSARDLANDRRVVMTSGSVAAGLRSMSSSFDLEDVNEEWASDFRRLNPAAFENGGHRWCVSLRAGEQCIAVLVLADRVGGAPYTGEELELLKCLAGQITSVLLSLQLASEVARARELEALRTMSAFFVHDLKNTAASLTLMLKNLPAHFGDPAFRDDALRAVGNAARRIDDMIGRLSAFRQRAEFVPVEADLNELVTDALGSVQHTPDVELTTELRPLPNILADRQQIQNVVTNLVLNARDAVGSGGRIHVRTEHRADRVVVSVADNGCGMTEAFVTNQLFRPFQSTKKNGLGIGLFQCQAIVKAHGGGIHVATHTGEGTTFSVSLPVMDQK